MEYFLTAIFWFFLGLVVFIYFIYPLVIMLISLLRGQKPVLQDITPFISLIIPVHNEEAVLREKLENVLSLDYPREKIEIIFALDGCTDRSRDILLGYQEAGVKILDKEQREGKVKTLNRAVSQAKGEILVFSDANSFYKEDALRKLVRNFSDSKVGCVCGKLVYTDVKNSSVSRGENLYWKYENFIKTEESRLGKLLITNGSIQAVRKELYPYPDADIADDFSLPILIQRQRARIVYEPEALTFEVATQSLKEEFGQKVRIISQGLKGTFKYWRTILQLGFLGIFEFLFHKLLRWFVPFFLIVIFLSNFILISKNRYFLFLALQVLFYSLALLGFLFRNKRRFKILYLPFYFCLVNFASLVAFLKFLRGSQTQIWEKAYTTRRDKETKVKYTSCRTPLGV